MGVQVQWWDLVSRAGLTSTRFLGQSRARRRKLGTGKQKLVQAAGEFRVSCPKWGSCRGAHAWPIRRGVKLR